MSSNKRVGSGRRWIVAVILLVAAIGVFVMYGRNPSQDGTQPSGPASVAPLEGQAVPVAVSRVEARSLTRRIAVNGQVIPVREVAVVPKISGTVEWLAGDVGHRVEEGQVIIRLEADELRAQLRQAEAALEAAEANLARLRAGATAEEREQANAALRQAEANLDQARRTFERMQSLYQQEAISQEQLESVRTQYEVAQAAYQTAEQQVKMLEKGATPEEIRAAQAQVSQAQASVELSRLQLERAEIRAPISGLIARRSVEVGGMAQAGASALVIVDIDKVYVSGAVSQSYIHRIHVGDRVTVEADATGQIFEGRVHTVSPASDSGGLFPIRVEIDNADHRLRPGMFARIHIPVEHAVDAPSVPVRAVVRRGEARAVFVVEPDGASAGQSAGQQTGRARLRLVTLGVEEGDHVAVTDGLEVGELVVITGQSSLSDGHPVTWTREE